MLSTVVAVLGLSAIAERAGPAVAGTLAGMPLGVAIVYFFVGIEQGPSFVTEAAPYTIGGFAATLCFNLGYWFVATRVHRHGLVLAMITAPLIFLLASFGLTLVTLTMWSAIGLVACFAVLSLVAMRNHQSTRIDNRLRMTWQLLAFRAGMAVIVVLIITGLADLIGPRWAGLLAGFPITLFPLLIVIHLSYSPEDASSIVKSFPQGLPALVIFVLCAWAVFEPLGVLLGMTVSLLVSLLWLTALFVLKTRLKAMRESQLD
ncbi:MAG: hypothetical protein AAGC96_03020 [Pseudomonadota bacterium]